MRRPPLWAVALLVAVLVVASGLLPAGSAAEVLRRNGSVLVFLVALTLLAELAQRAGVFDAAARAAVRRPGAVPRCCSRWWCCWPR